MTPKKDNKGIITYLAIASILAIVLMLVWSRLSSANVGKKYSDVMAYFDNYQVAQYELDLGSGDLDITLKGGKKVNYSVPSVQLFINDTENYREEYNKLNPEEPLIVDYEKVRDTSWLTALIPTLILVVAMAALFMFMMRQAGGGKYTSFGKANVNALKQGRKATFADVAGAEEEKHELEEIVEYLKNPAKFTDIGAKIPKGVLLMGPPGTGKTLLARAVAGEAGVPFYPISGSDFVEMFVGVGASRVRDLFNQAKKNAPAIIFIDEIDAVGRQRGAGLGGGNDEREQTLNQLLVEMDGFSGKESVIVIAATNRRDVLDPALLRPGRFDRQIVVGYPDVKGREEILKVHTKDKPLAPDVDLRIIAQSTAGFTGADLENLVNEAALLTARHNKRAITMPEIEEATIKVVAGPEKKSKEVTIADKRLTAYHESGHAVCTFYTEHTDDVHQVSIIPRGMAGGYTMSLPENDKSFVTKKEMEENIVTLLGGRVAEQIFLDDISTGASNDLERATSIAKKMVTKYGFSDELGPVVYGGSDQEEVFLGRDFNSTPAYSDEIAQKIDSEMHKIIETAYSQTKQILSSHKDQMHLLAKYLIKHEKIDKNDFKALMTGTMDKNEIEECMKIDTDFYDFGLTVQPE